MVQQDQQQVVIGTGTKTVDPSIGDNNIDNREHTSIVYDNSELNLVSLNAANAPEANFMAVCKQSRPNYTSLSVT